MFGLGGRPFVIGAARLGGTGTAFFTRPRPMSARFINGRVAVMLNFPDPLAEVRRLLIVIGSIHVTVTG